MTPNLVTTILLLLVMFLAVELYQHKQRDKRRDIEEAAEVERKRIAALPARQRRAVMAKAYADRFAALERQVEREAAEARAQGRPTEAEAREARDEARRIRRAAKAEPSAPLGGGVLDHSDEVETDAKSVIRRPGDSRPAT